MKDGNFNSLIGNFQISLDNNIKYQQCDEEYNEKRDQDQHSHHKQLKKFDSSRTRVTTTVMLCRNCVSWFFILNFPSVATLPRIVNPDLRMSQTPQQVSCILFTFLIQYTFQRSPRHNLFYDLNFEQEDQHHLSLQKIHVELAEEQNDSNFIHRGFTIPEVCSPFFSLLPLMKWSQTPLPSHHSHSEIYSGREIGRTTSYDITQFAAPPKKLKPSPCEIIEMPETPQKERSPHHHHHSSSSLTSSNSHDQISQYSRLHKDYEILDIIGSGSFGTVYRVRGKLDGINYAIKKSRRRPHNQNERTSQLVEVQALAALSAVQEDDSDQYKATATCCIVRYYSAWIEDDYLCIQMELCESSASDAILFDHHSAYHLLRDLLNALEVLHSNEFVHLDIKPANILVKKNRYKLADFGLALHTTNRRFNGNVEEGDSRSDPPSVSHLLDSHTSLSLSVSLSLSLVESDIWPKSSWIGRVLLISPSVTCSLLASVVCATSSSTLPFLTPPLPISLSPLPFSFRTLHSQISRTKWWQLASSSKWWN
jgi:hypothetical protein